MAEAENAERLVEVLKEIRDELRAVRLELGARGAAIPNGIRTRLVNRGARWRGPALAAAGVAGLTLVLGVALRDRAAPQPAAVAVAPPPMPAHVVSPAQPPAVLPPSVDPHAAGLVANAPAAAPAPAPKRVERLPAGAPAVAAVPAPAKKRPRPDVAARPPVEAVSDDQTMAFPPPPRRVRVHRLSYESVGSEPAKL